jgi:ubiquinone/menaquinone biosynthesis C-methylase UbiE
MDWKSFYENLEVDSKTIARNPCEWQIGLAEFIEDRMPGGKLLEAGSGHGVTSLLVGSSNRTKTLLDLESPAINLARQIFSFANQEAEFVIGNLFNMDFPENSFDLTFNAGVLEHFTFDERREALREMSRVTKPGGVVLAAVPNHFSKPYRYGYKYLQSKGKWPYPDEYSIYDFSSELMEIPELIDPERIILAPKTPFSFLRRHQRIFFRFYGIFQKLEGYLTVLTFKKHVNKQGKAE